jgi:hypothetical protein
MARTAANLAALVTVVVGGVVGIEPVFADPVGLVTVTLHVRDYDHVPAGELADAQKKASRVYARIGVRLVWTGGSAALAAKDEAAHFDVIILTSEMTGRLTASASEFGRASRAARRALIFHPRIQAHAAKTGSDPACVLALVLAHEVGHLLLPEYSHAPSGLMRAAWTGRVSGVPDFIHTQADAIRLLLATTD